MNVTAVAAGVLVRPDGEFLLAQRPATKAYAGYWEFPGGKLEAGETTSQALARELREELGIEVRSAHPWLTREYVYPHAAVRLHFCRVVQWDGDPRGLEGQALAWQRLPQLTVAPLLPANGPILRALALPADYALTDCAGLGEPAFLLALDGALARGLKLVQIREKTLAPDALMRFGAQVVARVHAAGGRVLLNGPDALARALGADGVHWSSAALAAATARPAGFALCGASCHDAADLARAAALDLDLAVLGPVLPTPTHPDHPGIGWPAFTALVRESPLPVYALGGMQPSHRGVALAAGAHGLAMLRQAWLP